MMPKIEVVIMQVAKTSLDVSKNYKNLPNYICNTDVNAKICSITHSVTIWHNQNLIKSKHRDQQYPTQAIQPLYYGTLTRGRVEEFRFLT